MMVGMIASAALFLSAAGVTLDEGLRRHPVLFVVVQAFGMTLAMVVWMRHRGHAWQGCCEMAAAMIVPAIPLICLRSLGVVSGSICGFYCLLTVGAMVLVMLYRRSDYGGISAVVSPG